MKLKKLLPITLLALLSLASCDVLPLPTDSDDPSVTDTSPTDSTEPSNDTSSDPTDSSSDTSSDPTDSSSDTSSDPTDSSSDTSSDPTDTSSDPTDTSSDPDPEPSLLADFIAGLDEGFVDVDDLYYVLDNIGEASKGINAAVIQRVEGFDPRILNDPSQAYLEEVSGYGLIDGDAVEVGVEVDLALAEDNGAGGYVLGDSFPYINEVMTVWDDGEEVHLTNLAEDDVDDPYSFAISADSDDVDIDDFKVFINSGNAEEYLYWAEAAYMAFAGGDDFEVVRLVAQAEKVVDEEDGDYLHLRYYTFGSWFDIYSAEGAGWGPSYAGVYVDRGEVWGFEAIINADGVFEAAYNYFDHLIEILYYDLNWDESDPVPEGSDDFDIEDLDLIIVDEGWGLVYDVTLFVFFSLDEVAIELPDVDDYREADASDTTYFFDLEDYGFEV